MMNIEPIDAAIRVMKMSNSAQVAMQHDLPSYMEEALNQKKKTRNESRKKKDKAAKLRQQVDDHEEDGKVIDYYRQNHPEWFNSFRKSPMRLFRRPGTQIKPPAPKIPVTDGSTNRPLGGVPTPNPTAPTPTPEGGGVLDQEMRHGPTDDGKAWSAGTPCPTCGRS